MKKFLVILLIAVIACEAVQQDIDLESWIGDLWDKLTGAVKKAWDWLNSSGVMDQIKSLLWSAGKAAAIALCSTYFTPAVCSTVIGLLL
jgi:hypothetical protein